MRTKGDVTVPEGKDNLVLQLLSNLRNSGIPVPNLEIVLEKRIPTEAGLGGGSSDAAAVIRLLWKFFDSVDLSCSECIETARTLGTDVPFFLKGGTVLAEGRGTDFTRVHGREARILLAVPPYSMSTEQAYERIDPRESLIPFDERLSGEVEMIDWEAIDLTNDFESVLRSEHDLHEELIESLGEFSDSVGLTGSGSALYALFDPGTPVQSIRMRLAETFDRTDFTVERFLAKNSMPEGERIP